jgi:hypothetical protein
MHSELRARIAFRLTGLRPEAAPRSPQARNLRPALAARFHDLAAVRYDFPVVALARTDAGEFAAPLTVTFDRLLAEVANDDKDGARIRRAVLQLEQEIRRRIARGEGGTLQHLWDAAAERLAAEGGETLATDLARARKALAADGELLDCDAAFPGEFLLAAWKLVQARKATRFQKEAKRLIMALGDILRADDARSDAGRSPASLQAAVGGAHRQVFDFDVMSRLLARGAPARPLPESRRRRIRALIVALESQRFFLDESGFTFVFERCGPALRAFRARYARLRALARSLAMARLEIAGEYDESRHEAIFRQLRESSLGTEELAQFPDYLVRVREGELDATGRAELLELLASGMPAKILLQSDDLLEDATYGEGLAAVAARTDALCGAAVGLDEVFVLQASAANLPRMGPQVLQGLEYRGPALFSVFSGATGDTSALPAYLTAAAATESRAFPTFTYDPRVSLDAASRFCLDGNPQPDRDWPVHAFEYEDAAHQRVQRELAFTLADFVASDERFARHFLDFPGQPLVSAADWLDRDATADFGAAAPAIAMVDPDNRLREIVVDEPIVNLARRGRDRWRRLQRLAASGAAPSPQPVTDSVPAVAETPAAAPPALAPAPAAAPAAPPVEVAKAPAPDEPYIETPRCTTCNECTQLNGRMFAYDGNKQAYIADVSAGTYRELVDAAESCQVSIIHPGKPRNPDEPGLEELLERARPFL